MPFQLEDGSGFIVIESAGEIWLENDVASSGIKWPRCCCVGAELTVHGCNGIILANTDIQFWNELGGTLLFTRTTDSNGIISGLTGSYYVVPDIARYIGQTITIAGPTNVGFGPSSSYVCFTGCVIPISKTIHLSDSVFGAVTLTWGTTSGPDGTPGWSGSPSPQPMVGGCCLPAVTGTLTYKVSNTGVFYGIEGFTPYLEDDSMSVTCYPFNYSKSFENSGGCGGDAFFTWCATPVDITITE